MTEKQVKHLMTHAEQDEIYQDMMKLQSYYAPVYLRILQSLSTDEKYSLELYLKACVGAESRIARTAYFLTPKK